MPLKRQLWRWSAGQPLNLGHLPTAMNWMCMKWIAVERHFLWGRFLKRLIVESTGSCIHEKIQKFNTCGRSIFYPELIQRPWFWLEERNKGTNTMWRTEAGWATNDANIITVSPIPAHVIALKKTGYFNCVFFHQMPESIICNILWMGKTNARSQANPVELAQSITIYILVG